MSAALWAAFLFDQVCKTVVDHPFQILRRYLHLGANTPCTEQDGVKGPCALMKNGRKGLLHADGRASSMDIACQRQQILGLHHLDRLLPHRPRRLFQIQFLPNGNHKHIVSPGMAHRHQGFEHPVRVLPQQLGHLDAGQSLPRAIVMGSVGNLFLVQHTHYVGLLLHGYFPPSRWECPKQIAR